MEELLTFMGKELAGNLDKLAAHAGLSQFHLSRKFRETMGKSPMSYFTQMKIQRACELLDTPEDSVQEVAASPGYNTPCYFSEGFKRVTGLSPSGYRKDRLAKEKEKASPGRCPSFVLRRFSVKKLQVLLRCFPPAPLSSPGKEAP